MPDTPEMPEMPEIPKLPEIPKEVKEKLEQLKKDIEKFKESLIKKDKEKRVIGVALLPPTNIDRLKQEAAEEGKELSKEEVEAEKQKINVLVLVNSDNLKDPVSFMQKITKLINDAAKEVNPRIAPKVVTLYDIRESCFEGKYDVLQTIAMSAPLYDPLDVLSALKIAEVHKTMVLKKFEKYIVCYVGAGSLFRGEKSGDIDVYIVVDDTDVKRMPRTELKDRLGAIIRMMGMQAAEITGVKKSFHIQTYILTDFWESIKDANPVIFTFLRDGVPLFDRGIFMPWKLLLKMGRIKPSLESIEMQMEVGERLMERTKYKLLSVIGEDLYWGLINPAQAALMLYGLAPPTPRETIKLLGEIFVKKEKILEEKHVKTLEKIFKYYKDIEHRKIKEVSGKDIDQLLEEAEEYLKSIKKVFSQIQKKKDQQNVNETYKACVKLAKDILEANGIKATEQNLVNQFKKLAEKEKFPPAFVMVLKDIINLKKEFIKKKYSSEEIEKIRRDARIFFKSMLEYLETKKFFELEKAKIKFKYGEHLGEAIIYQDNIYIVEDVKAPEKKIVKAKIKSDGSLSKVESCSLEDFENILSKIKMPVSITIKEKTLESLRDLYGKDIEFII